MARWSVYKIVRKRGRSIPEAIPLGYVNADNQPRALDRAWRRWPRERVESQTQAGFSVRCYATDHLPLGKLYTR